MDRSLASRKPTRAEILRARADAAEALAECDRQLAAIEELESTAPRTKWISQVDSPIGRRKHLELWRRLRDAKVAGVRASGKLRLIERDTFDASLAEAGAAPRRRRPNASSEEQSLDEIFGVR